MNSQNIYVGSVMPGIIDTPMQDEIRHMSKAQFPEVAEFQVYYQTRQLIAPEICARFLTWLLLDVDTKQFTSHEWDIYQQDHHRHWLREEMLTGTR